MILAAVGVVVIYVAAFNRRGRKHERQIRLQRGVQTAGDFAALFHAPIEQYIAEKLFSYLQMGTFTKQFSFSRDDKLWEPPLSFVKDDMEDNLQLGFWDELDLGLTAEDGKFRDQYLSARTVGELVQIIASIYSSRYSSVPLSR